MERTAKKEAAQGGQQGQTASKSKVGHYAKEFLKALERGDYDRLSLSSRSDLPEKN